MQETAEHERVQRDAEIARNTNENERDGVVFFRELCEDERAAERNDLRCEQEDDLTDRVEVQVCADIDGVIDDGAHAVYVQEECDEEEQHLFVVRRDVFEGVEDFRERLADIMPLGFHIVALLKAANERNGDEQPPHGSHREADAFRKHIRQHADHIGPKHIGDERDEERDARADVSPCKAVGRNLVHAFFAGDVVQHGIIDGQRRAVTNLREHKNDEEQQPAGDEAV